MTLQFEHNNLFRNELKEQKGFMEYMNKELDDMSKEFYGLKSQIAHFEKLIAEIRISKPPIKSLFCNMNLDNDGTRDESTLVRRRHKNSEFLDLDAKIGKSGIEEIKTLDINEPTVLDFQ